GRAAGTLHDSLARLAAARRARPDPDVKSLRATIPAGRGRRGAGAPPSEATIPAGRAGGRRGAGAPPFEATIPAGRAGGRRGAGAPPFEATIPAGRAAGRRGAGAPPSEATIPKEKSMRVWRLRGLVLVSAVLLAGAPLGAQPPAQEKVSLRLNWYLGGCTRRSTTAKNAASTRPRESISPSTRGAAPPT